MPFTAKAAPASALLSLAAAATLALAVPAAAQMRHARIGASHAGANHVGVSYDRASRGMGGAPLVSDGPGTGFGFHRLPQPYRFAAAAHRDRQAVALRDTVITDALTNGNGNYGFALPGDSVYGFGNRASYGVFSGSDGYGSPFFAGWYGRGNGADLGPLGHTYE